jgi:hypothetical protein
VGKLFAQVNSVGSQRVAVTNSDINLTESAAASLIARAKAAVSDPAVVRGRVRGGSVGYLDTAVLNAFTGTTDQLLGHIKSVICGDVPCAVSQGAGRRRLRELQSSGEIVVSVEFDLDDTLFDDLVAREAFTDPGFAAALAAAAGVHPDNVTVTTAESSLEVDFVVAEESDGVNPVDTAVLAILQELVDGMQGVVDAAATELGIPPSSITVGGVDRCADRDCNGRGSCDPNTGICACSDPAFWGVNCETPVSCENGGTPRSDTAYCTCPYPYYDARCNSTRLECSSGCGPA